MTPQALSFANSIVDREERLNAVLTQYFEAAETGNTLDRETWLATHADISAELKDFLVAQDRVDQFSGPLRRTTRTAWIPGEQRQFGDYELREEIGRGGMGVVYKAWQKSLDRLVAIKMIHPRCRGTLTELQRFRMESEAAAHLDHPNIVPIYDVGEQDGQLYFSMKLIDGGSLATLRPEELDAAHIRRVAQMMATIAHAVHHAHQRGVLHRDLKPSNILVHSDGRPYIADFGLAKQLHADNDVTQTGAVLGTPAYMAPEQAGLSSSDSFSGNDGLVLRSTTATDVYGVGAILYASVTGRAPFQGASPLHIFALVKDHEPTPPSRLNPLVDRDLEAICLKCLEKDPARRYRSAELLAEDLEAWVQGAPTQARPISRLNRVGRWCRRNPVLASMTGSLVFLLVSGFAAMTVGLVVIDRQRQTAERFRQEAKDQAIKLRHRLYVTQMGVGFRQWERAELEELRQVLDEFSPNAMPSKEDLRGFEWHYLSRLASAKPDALADYSGHQGSIFCANFSPDGKYVASCGEDRSIQLWDAATGEQKAILRPNPGTANLPLKGHQEDENYVAFSPDGRQLASACEDGTVRLWDLASQTWEPLVPKSNGEVLSLDFSADGQRLVAAGVDQVIRIWDAKSRSLQLELTKHTATVSQVVFSRDGRKLVSGGHDGFVHVWDIEKRNVETSFAVNDPVMCTAISADGEFVASGDMKGQVLIWHVPTGKGWENCGSHTRVRSAHFSPNGRWLATSGDDGDVRIWSTDQVQLHNQFIAGVSSIWCVRFSPDGTRLVTAGNRGRTTVWPFPQSSQPRYWRARGLERASQFEFAPQTAELSGVNGEVAQRRVALSTGLGEILLGDLNKRVDLELISNQAPILSSVAFSSDGRKLAFLGRDGAVKCWGIDEQREQTIVPARQPGPGDVESPWMWGISRIRVAGLSRGRFIVIYGDGIARIWDGDRVSEFRVCRSGDTWVGPAFALSADRTTMAFYFKDVNGEVHVWDAETVQPKAHYLCIGSPHSLSISGDNQLLALGHADGRISIVELMSGDDRVSMVGHRQTVTSLAFARDGKTLASGAADGTVRLWHVPTGQELIVIEDRQGQYISSVAFSPDGQVLAVVGLGWVKSPSTISVFDIGSPSETTHQQSQEQNIPLR